MALTASSTSLLGDQLVADHLVREHLGFRRRIDDANTALQAIVETALASSAGKDLCLDDHVIGADLFCDALRLAR